MAIPTKWINLRNDRISPLMLNRLIRNLNSAEKLLHGITVISERFQQISWATSEESSPNQRKKMCGQIVWMLFFEFKLNYQIDSKGPYELGRGSPRIE